MEQETALEADGRIGRGSEGGGDAARRGFSTGFGVVRRLRAKATGAEWLGLC